MTILPPIDNFVRKSKAPNGRVQPRCAAQRSNVGCNTVLGGHSLLFSQEKEG